MAARDDIRRRIASRASRFARSRDTDAVRRARINLALTTLVTAATSVALLFSVAPRRGSSQGSAYRAIIPSFEGRTPMASEQHGTARAEHGHDSDIAPGDDKAGHGSVRDSVLGYVVGLVLASALTAASFLAVGTDLIYGPGIPVALIVFAIAQMGVHLVFFLHITTGPDNTNNVLALAFGVLIVLLLIAGSLWIMHHLDRNMMPSDPMGIMNQMPM